MVRPEPPARGDEAQEWIPPKGRSEVEGAPPEGKHQEERAARLQRCQFEELRSPGESRVVVSAVYLAFSLERSPGNRADDQQ
jgi:hypothetical protein